MSSPPGGNAGAPADSLCDRNVHDPATLRDVQCTPSNERFTWEREREREFQFPPIFKRFRHHSAVGRTWEMPTCRALLEAMLEPHAIPSLTEEAKSQG